MTRTSGGFTMMLSLTNSQPLFVQLKIELAGRRVLLRLNTSTRPVILSFPSTFAGYNGSAIPVVIDNAKRAAADAHFAAKSIRIWFSYYNRREGQFTLTMSYFQSSTDTDSC